jgi:alanyl-tRNA synthetase
LRAEVAVPLRDSTRRNHTATHLLHASLRQVLGTHVKQAGSVVEPGRLRFDFTHYAAMDRAELEEVERLMNEQILRNQGVETSILPLDRAIATGAMALFGEKYGDEVRVVTVPGFSSELCGGTHVRRTGDIGVCKIVYEGSISAGVRRIEAITGEAALHQYQETSGALRRIADLVRSSEPELIEHVGKLLANERLLAKQVDQLKEKLAQAAVGALETQARTVNGARVLAARLDGMDRQQMRSLADSLRNKWKSAVVVLSSADEGTVAIVAAVTKDLTSKVQAGKLVSAVALATGGKGGGRPDMAEGGGKDAGALDGAMEAVYRDIESKL